MPAARSTPAVIPATTTTAAPTPLRQVRARTTKANQKLVVLSDGGEDGAELLEERVRRRQTLLPQGHADAGRSTDAERGITETKQQRLVAYCTCREYRRAWTHIERKIHTYFAEDAERRRIRRRTSAVALDGMSHAYADAFGYAPMERFEVHLQRFDECSYIRVQRQVAWTVATGTEQPPPSLTEIFVMDYGATVFWGAESAAEEREFLRRFLQVVYVEPIAEEEQEQEELWFEEKAGRTPKIYNNVVVLNAHSPDNIMRKVTISMVIAQSVKLAQFERLVDECIDTTEHIPHVLARDGFIRMSRTESLQAIGKLFHVRTNITLNSSVTDTPNLFWTDEPAFRPIYEAVAMYFEISQRVTILNQRAVVLSDVLGLLNEHLSKKHGEHLEWVVIMLVFVSVVLAGFTIYIKVQLHVG